MLLKEFVKLHQDKFTKTPVEAYNTEKKFIQELIEAYPTRVPNVFEEAKLKNLNETKFYKWWEYQVGKAKKKTKLPDYNEKIKRTKKIIVKEKVVKVKPVKVKPVKEKKRAEKKKISQEVALLDSLQKKPLKPLKKEKIIKQTIEVSQVYHKVVFKTELANEMYKTIDTNLKRIKINCLEINAMIKEYKQKIQDQPTYADVFLKQLQCYEKMYKIQSDAFNDNQNQLMQLRMLIENDKQIFDNNLYEKTQNQAEEDDLDEEVERIAKEIDNKEIKDVN